jgi:PhnB protein
MQINSHINFDGQCKEAFAFYADTLEAKLEFMMTWGEMPGGDQFPPETHHLVMHATLRIGDGTLMGADSRPGHYQKPKGISVALHFKDRADGERVFKALSDGGEVSMPFDKTFWSPGFGMCTDRFGVPWMVNTQGEMET